MTKTVQVIIEELAIQATIRELTLSETNKMLENDLFRYFGPARCSRCGVKSDFTRRIFHITGIRKNKQNDEATQNMLQYHFLHYHKITWVFFRTHSKKFYADSAGCPSCKSTAITFDLSYDYMMDEYEKMAGKNIIRFKEKN